MDYLHCTPDRPTGAPISSVVVRQRTGTNYGSSVLINVPCGAPAVSLLLCRSFFDAPFVTNIDGQSRIFTDIHGHSRIFTGIHGHSRTASIARILRAKIPNANAYFPSVTPALLYSINHSSVCTQSPSVIPCWKHPLPTSSPHTYQGFNNLPLISSAILSYTHTTFRTFSLYCYLTRSPSINILSSNQVPDPLWFCVNTHGYNTH